MHVTPQTPIRSHSSCWANADSTIVTVTVTATSKTAGTAVIENVSTGKTVTHTFTGGVDGDLCEYNAEWIVEDFEEGGSLVTFADFGSVTFVRIIILLRHAKSKMLTG
jgi:hypothetical protein